MAKDDPRGCRRGHGERMEAEREARVVPAALARRMEEAGLALHPGKTKVVYCGVSRAREGA